MDIETQTFLLLIVPPAIMAAFGCVAFKYAHRDNDVSRMLMGAIVAIAGLYWAILATLA